MTTGQALYATVGVLLLVGIIGWGVVRGAGPSDEWDTHVADALKHLEEDRP